jgi:hypothetical protein
MSFKEEIAERLSKCLQERHGSEHGWKRRAADELRMKPQQFGDLIKGRRTPGNKTQDKLRECGYDVNYIMTGETEKELHEKFNKIIALQKEKMLSDGEWEIITAMRKLGIGKLMDFNIYFDYARAVNDRLDSMGIRKVAEPKLKYKITKKRKGR